MFWFQSKDIDDGGLNEEEGDYDALNDETFGAEDTFG
jgi:hypothetical protein